MRSREAFARAHRVRATLEGETAVDIFVLAHARHRLFGLDVRLEAVLVFAVEEFELVRGPLDQPSLHLVEARSDIAVFFDSFEARPAALRLRARVVEHGGGARFCLLLEPPCTAQTWHRRGQHFQITEGVGMTRSW